MTSVKRSLDSQKGHKTHLENHCSGKSLTCEISKTLSKSTASLGPRTKTHNLVGDISHSNHTMKEEQVKDREKTHRRIHSGNRQNLFKWI